MWMSCGGTSRWICCAFRHAPRDSFQESPDWPVIAGLEYLNRGDANESAEHLDFMIGSDKMAVDGILPNGNNEPIMREGEWTFNV